MAENQSRPFAEKNVLIPLHHLREELAEESAGRGDRATKNRNGPRDHSRLAAVLQGIPDRLFSVSLLECITLVVLLATLGNGQL